MEHSARRGWGALLALIAFAAPHQAASQTAPVANFLRELGGTEDEHKLGFGASSPERRVLEANRAQVIGWRALSNKRSDDAMDDTRRALAAYARDCAAKGGTLDAPDSASTRAFQKQALDPHIGPRLGLDYWRSVATVCAAHDGSVLGAFAAVVHDNTDVGRRGDPGSRALVKLFGLPTTTAVFAFAPGSAPTNADLAGQDRAWRDIEARARATTEMARQRHERALVDWRAGLKVGDRTNCGLVVDLRGPLVRVQLPAGMTLANGASEVWVRREALSDNGTEETCRHE